MIQQVTRSVFIDGFDGSHKDNFTYEGKVALFEYLEEYEESVGEQIEFDHVALCCEYSEYDNALECAKGVYLFAPEEDNTEEEQEKEAREWLEERTQVIEVGNTGRIIIQDF